MFAAVGLQVLSVTLLGLVAGLACDWTTAKFFVIGGAAATVPNALFALRLAVHRKKPAESYPVVFLLGEFVKIGLTVGLLAWIAHWQEVRWLALILGLIVALKAPLFALLIVRDAPRDWPEQESDMERTGSRK
jgi:ATP synthase protein I